MDGKEGGGAGFLAYAALIFITAIWGLSFVWVRDAVAVYPVFLFLAIRFTLAAFLVAVVLAPRLAGATRASLAGGALMGVALFTGYSLQTFGLTFTTAANSGFITGLFVVFTPLFEAVIHRRFPHRLVVLGVALATAGLAALSWKGASGSVNPGDLLSLACAAVYAIHLLLTSRMSRRHDTAPLVVAQLATVAALAWIFSVPHLREMTPVPWAAAKGILLTAVFASALAYFVQTVFQRRVSPTQAALVFTLEPVFAGLFAILAGGERLGAGALLGGGLIIAGMITGEAASRKSSAAA